ncbi:Myosin type-2 heavy chain 1, partial [Dipsacomyces acuminosporus]
GTKAFFADDELAWVQAVLTEKTVDESNRIVKLSFARDQEDSPSVYSFEATFDELIKKTKVLPPLCNPPLLEGIDDLTNLSHLNEPAVLHNLQVRYSMHNIYTYSGIVLVALNPFARVPLYSQDTLEAYAGRMRGELEPHLFAISEDAFQGMVRDKRNQTIIVSGESGAGKTMSAKYIMRYFASAHDDSELTGGGKNGNGSKGGSGGASTISRVEEQILATNPVLESFGNAKTTRNDNSSRFGKFLEIRFNERHAIEAAFIRTYLLERSRLVYQPSIERNYHIFYQLLAAVPQEDRQEFGLVDATWRTFSYTSQGGTGEIAGVDDAREFKITCDALAVIGVSPDKQKQIYKLLAALLHLGNLEIGGSERMGASIQDDNESCNKVIELLQIDGALFRKWLTKKQIVTRSEKIVSNLTKLQAQVVRDSVAKFIYAHLFDWIVFTINASLSGTDKGLDGNPASFIGVLDIYGFEHFEHNSFEQFCINYANEKLQQNFNRHVFKLEQEEYQREQLQNWTFVDFQDNQPCIDLIEGKLGVLSLLDEESRLQQGTDLTFAEKLYKQFAQAPKPPKDSPSAFFKKPRFGSDKFTIRHYAHDVTYEAEGFIDKNKDTVPDEIQNVLKASGDDLLTTIIAEQEAEQPAAAPKGRLSVRAARKPTLGTVFKHSLVSLMETIEATESHYIRCIKPNEAKAAWLFDGPMVLSQLRACGVLETIRISCAGYPSRLAIPEFIHRYRILLPTLTSSITNAQSVDDYRDMASSILTAAFTEEDRYQVGLTKVFFRAGMLALIEKLRVEKLNVAATAIQSLVRCYQQRTRFLAQRSAAHLIQRQVRGYLARRELQKRRDTRAAVIIQSAIRGYLARTKFLNTRRSAVRMQSLIRGKLARANYQTKRQNHAAGIIQKHVRGHQQRRAYQQSKHLITRMQCNVRVKIAKRVLSERKQEARSAAHFQEVTYKLEGKLMEITRQLQAQRNESKQLAKQLDESQVKVNQLTEKLGVAQEESKSLRANQDESIRTATAQLTQQVAEITAAKLAVDEKCSELSQELVSTSEQLEKVRSEASKEKNDLLTAREELEKKLNELEAELQSSKTQLADARAQHQQQMLIYQQQGSSALQQANADQPSSIKRSDTNKWKASAGLSATGYELTESAAATPPRVPQNNALYNVAAGVAATGAAAGLSQQQSDIQRRPYSVDTARGDVSGTAAAAAMASKRTTIGGEEGRALARMLGFGGAANNNGTIAEEEDTGQQAIFELRNEDEVCEMLENDENLISEILNELIGDLQVPLPNLDAEYSPPDLLFPAHLIGLCVIKMFQYNLSRRIDRMLLSAIARIQKKTAAFESDYTSAFWLSNVFELLSIIKTSMTEHQSSTYEYAESERAMNDGMQYLETLLSDIYFGWIKDLQKRFGKLIIPGVVESEALPGFTASDSGFFNRLMGTGTRESTVKIENVLSFFNHIWRTMEFYYVDQAIMRQIMSELLCNIGVTAFNNIIMRRNFCSWKRGMQIQYNLTRIEEWCKAHTVQDTTRNLDRLLQLVKLLQLQKSSEQDIDIMFEVCDLLNPSQIKKLLSIYAVSDYENPIVGPVMNEVTRRAQASEKTDNILLDTNDLTDQVLYLTARKVPAIETYIPPEFKMPRIRALVDSQTDMAYDDDIEDVEEDLPNLSEYDDYSVPNSANGGNQAYAN